MDDDGVPEPFTMPIPPGFPPPPHGGDRVLFFRTHETEATPGGKEHEDIMLRRVPREVAMRYRAAAGGRAMTHAQYLDGARRAARPDPRAGGRRRRDRAGRARGARPADRRRVSDAAS